MGEFPKGLPDNAINVKEHRCTINGKEDYYYSYMTVSSTPNMKLKIDPNATATVLPTFERRLKCFGDLVIDQDTGERIPLRMLSKEQRKKYE